MKRWKKLTLIIGLPVMLLITFSAWAGGGFFGGTSVCSTCGRMQSTSRVFWIPVTTMKETELSGFYDDFKGDDGHEHTWKFGSGGGGAILCAIGGGRHLYSVIRNEEIVQSLEEIRKNRDEETVDKWLARLLDPELSSAAASSLYYLIDDPEDFDTALTEAEEAFEFYRLRIENH